MRMIDFDQKIGRPISEFGSQSAAHVRVAVVNAPAHASYIHLEPGGLVGMHPAAQQQLFMVVQGSGWVRGENTDKLPIAAGRAILWEAGELHESGTETGMGAIVLEAERLELLRELG